MEPPATPHLPSSKRRRVEGVQPTPPQKYSELLASFGALQSPMSTKRMQQQTHSLRPKPAVTYAESETSSAAAMSPQSSFANSPVKSDADPVDLMSEDEDDTIEVLPRANVANGTRQSLGRSTKKLTSYAVSRRVLKKPQAKQSKGGRSKRLLTSDASQQPRQEALKPTTARAAIRQDILEQTKPKRDAFLLAKYDLFAPLLPENNYIDKLERVHAMSDAGEVEIIPHPNVVAQPAGIKATMKPYQLEGLSFLVHMYNNGMSAILGDEMGLGKTLQTLSLFQYVTETDPITSTGEARPFLVVCPLSVLSSWINEASRWTPGFKVIRFHGPKVERERLKQETMGMVDRYGQQTAKSKAKVKASRQKRAARTSTEGKVMNLDSSDEEEEIAKPVDLVVTTYETFVAEQTWFKRAYAWRYVVLDEGHKVKNEKSDVASALQGMSAEHKLLLTGTPLQNNLQELWALLHWLFPEVFTLDSATSFKHAFDLSHGKASTSFMDHARRLLEVIMLRRMKNSPGVNLNLPPKEEVLLFVPLTPMQRFWYTRLLTRMDNGLLDDLFRGAKNKEERALKQQGDEDSKLAVLEQATAAADSDVWADSKEIIVQTMENTEESKGSDWHKLMNIIMQLRKCCSHPYLLPGAQPSPYFLGDHIRTASGKFVVLDKLVQELVLNKQKKVLIFSQFTKTLDFVEELLALKGGNAGPGAAFRYNRFDGSTGRARRNLAIRLFNDMTSDFRIMLISTRAGGLGINLTSATNIVFMDEDWNPQVTLQAEARAHRIGQTKPVTVYKLCTQGTVEEQMMGRIRKKLYLSAKITESMRNLHTVGTQDNKKRKRGPRAKPAEDETPQLAASELKNLLRRGAQTLSAPQVDVTEMLSWDWATTLSKCKDRANNPHIADPSGKPQTAEIDEEAWLTNIERVETAVFEGKTHQRAIEKAEKARTDLVRSDRRVGKNTTVMVDGFAINKESLNCADWEAVPTLAGKDPSLAEPKREKKDPIVHQEHCQICWDGGDMYLCAGCPRSYHLKCLDPGMKAVAKARFGMFYCPQHQCFDCEKKTADAGGLIYRCRWCEKGFCEDCLDWDGVRLVGENLPELDVLGFRERNTGGWYVDCPDCVGRWRQDPGDELRCKKERERFEREYEALVSAGEVVGGGAVERGAETPTTVSEALTPVEATLPVSKKVKTGLLWQSGGVLSA